MVKFHSEDYVKFLQRVTPDNLKDITAEMQRCTLIPNPMMIMKILTRLT